MKECEFSTLSFESGAFPDRWKHAVLLAHYEKVAAIHMCNATGVHDERIYRAKPRKPKLALSAARRTASVV